MHPTHSLARRNARTSLGRSLRHAVSALLIGTFASTSVLAVSPLEGRYQGRGEGRLDLQVFAIDDDSDEHFVVVATAIPNLCSGSLRGLAKRTMPTTLVLTRKPREDDDTCTLTLRFSPDHRRVTISEDGCGYFHGPSCAFDGALNRR